MRTTIGVLFSVGALLSAACGLDEEEKNACRNTGDCLDGLICSADTATCETPDSGPAGMAGTAGTAGTAGMAGTAGTAGMAGSAGLGGAGGTAGSACGSPTGGPTMVVLPGGYCIDTTEVTRAQYALWLLNEPSLSDQMPTCGWNDTYEPDCEWPPGTKEDHPVVCVDWCDAYAYCASVGKRLCGKISGGENDFEQHEDVSTSQWYAACTSGGQYDYPYWNEYWGSVCNGVDAGNGTTVPVASMSNCHSPVGAYAEVYDLSGNAWEWEDSCKDMGTTGSCHVRGGSFFQDYHYLGCGSDYDTLRNAHGSTLGFRCCSSP